MGLFKRLLLDVARLAHSARIHDSVAVGAVRGHLFAADFEVAFLTEATAVVFQVGVLALGYLLGSPRLSFLRGRLSSHLLESRALIEATRLFLTFGLDLIGLDRGISWRISRLIHRSAEVLQQSRGVLGLLGNRS